MVCMVEVHVPRAGTSRKRFGHVLRKKEERRCATALSWPPEGKRRVGRPPKQDGAEQWEKERKELGWKSWREAKTVARRMLERKPYSLMGSKRTSK